MRGLLLPGSALLVWLPCIALAQNAEPPNAPVGAQPAPEQPAPSRQWPNQWVPASTALVQVLNKVDASSQNLTIGVGETATYRSLAISVQACAVRPPTQPPDSAAYLVISDAHKGEPGFKGWSLANESWVSMLQNPSYNVRVLGCR